MRLAYLLFHFLLILSSTAMAFDNDVTSACSKSGLFIPELNFRDRGSNLQKLRAFDFGSSAEARALRDFYRVGTPDAYEEVLVAKSDDLNARFQPDSDMKTAALRFSSRGRREADPRGYISAVVGMATKYLPVDLDSMDWFSSLHDARVVAQIVVAPRGLLGESYGAVESLNRRSDGKYSLEVLLSNNASEPLPYLIPLLAHELEHARTYETQIALYDKPALDVAQKIVNEALAFDVEMRSYVSMARANPNLFCNWIYDSWSRGELVVPLSANMAAKLEEMKSGHFIADYAKTGGYAKHPELRTADGRLREDLRTQIADLHLKYVRDH